MGYVTEYQSDNEIVVVKVEGILNFDIVRQYSTESTKLARLNKCEKFLIEHTGEDQKSESYHIHADRSELEQFGFTKTDMIAIVIPLSKQDHLARESAVYDEGMNNVKYFESVEEATQWLNDNK
jgi:hypothetical protein